MYLIVKDVLNIVSSSSLTNILIGFSTEGDMYAAQFPTYYFLDEKINAKYWSSSLLLSNFTTYAHLRGTDLIAIQYNVTFGSGYPAGCSADYCLAFYNLTLLTQDSKNPLTFFLTTMLATPFCTHQLSNLFNIFSFFFCIILKFYFSHSFLRFF